MSSIFEALTKAQQEAQQGSRDATPAKRAEPWEKALETIAIRETQQTEMPDATADATGQGGPSLLKPHRMVAATLVFLLLVAGAIATDVWLRPAAVTTARANYEASHHRETPRWSGPVTLRGEIADGLNIKMQLVREGSKLSGSYYYEHIGRDIPVRGTIGETGGIVLEEFVKERKTGVFMGKFVSAARIEGKWSKPGSTRSRDFFLVGTGLLNGMPVSNDQGRMGQQQAEYPFG